MGLASGSIVFVLAWWICFFAVLPIGVRGQWEDDSTVPGTEEAAPSNPMLMKKVLWASVGAAIVTGLAALIIPRLLAQ
jgi:predicted secreted protein